MEEKERGMEHTSNTTSTRGWFNRPTKPYANPYLGGLLLGIVLFLAFLLPGTGLGASGALAAVAAFLVDLIAPAHVDRVPILAHIAGGHKNPFSSWLIPVVIGLMIGGFVSGVIGGRAKWETTRGPRISDRTRWVLAFIGGFLFVYGARLARGCTSGQALTGGAVLSAGSWAIMMAIFAGAYALAYFFRKVWN